MNNEDILAKLQDACISNTSQARTGNMGLWQKEVGKVTVEQTKPKMRDTLQRERKEKGSMLARWCPLFFWYVCTGNLISFLLH